jgi:hypothetical protein
MAESPPGRPIGWSKAGGLVVAVFIVLVLAAVEVFLAERIKGLRENATQLQKQISLIEQRVGRLELQMETLLARRLPDGNAGPNRPEGNTPTKDSPAKVETPTALTRAEIDIIRDYIKIPPPAAGVSPTISLGVPIGNHVLVPLPSQITDKVPKLVGARFTTDRNGSIVIVTVNGGRADFIIPPN